METSGSSGFSLAQYTELRSATQRVIDTGQILARAHYASRNALLSSASRTLEQLRMSELGLLGLLFVFGVALSMLVYRDMVAPLRVKLVESQALALVARGHDGFECARPRKQNEHSIPQSPQKISASRLSASHN